MKILFFWEIWVQYKCFWKAFHLILMHFVHKILCFEEFLHKIALFFKNLIFPDFRLIEPVSRPIEIAIKILFWICLVRSMLDRYWINRMYFWSIKSIFWSIENSTESFFLKPLAFHVFNTFSKFSKAFLSLFVRSRIQSKIFVVFPQIFSKVFVF